MKDVTIGANCSIHETARLVGPLVLGDDNIVEESAIIESDVIGRGNRFEIGCVVAAKTVGDYNVFRPRSRVDADASVTDGCCVGATVHVVRGELRPNTSLWRRDDHVNTLTADHLTDLHRIIVDAHRPPS